MKLYVMPAGPIQTNGYLLTHAARGEAVLVDAPGDIWSQVAPVLERDGCKLTQLWLTHGHWDHTQGAAEIVRETGAKVFAHRDDQPLIETPEVMTVFVRGIDVEPVKVDRWIEGGDTLPAVGLEAEVRHVPGHCPGNVLFYFAKGGLALVGDALFKGSVGRTDLPGGSMDVLEASIRERIYTLPDDTKVFPGHGAATTVGAEKRSNPYVHA